MGFKFFCLSPIWTRFSMHPKIAMIKVAFLEFQYFHSTEHQNYFKSGINPTIYFTPTSWSKMDNMSRCYIFGFAYFPFFGKNLLCRLLDIVFQCLQHIWWHHQPSPCQTTIRTLTSTNPKIEKNTSHWNAITISKINQ